MKKLIISLTIFTFLFIPLRSYGNIEQVRIQRIVLLTAAACAVNIQVLSIVNNQFNGSEALLFGNLEVATLAALLLLAVTITANSFILFASPAFQALTGIEPDVPITDGDCALLQSGNEVSFTGSFGATIAAVTILAGFVFNFAMVFLASTGDYDLFDLSLFSLILTSLLFGAYPPIGNGPLIDEGGGGDDGGGGCALSNNHQGSQSWALWGFLALGSLGWGIRRRVNSTI